METEKKEEMLRQACRYFSQPGFERLWDGLRERYVALGRVGGTVTLRTLRPQERDTLEGFLQKDCHHQKSITISVEKIEKALKKTRFSQISLEELFHAMFPEGLVSKKEQTQQRREQTEEHFQLMLQQAQKSVAGNWFQEVLEEKKGAYQLLKQDELRSWEWTKENLPILFRALNNLPCREKKRLRLPVFASQVSGNPHFFDEGTRMFRYLLYGICGVCKIPYPNRQDAESRAELLYQAGILKDDISNTVTAIGLLAHYENGALHPGIHGFWQAGEMLQLNLFHLGQLGCVESVHNRVYVVENPSIFQKLVEETHGSETIVCSNGQLRLAVLVLLDFLTESGSTLFYSGDFDPEGLVIAQKLKNRYGTKLEFWHYEIADYEQAKSSEEISETRLKQLVHLQEPALQVIGKRMKEERLAGYQENILERLRIENL